jgi:hypothetical protein
MHNTQQNQGTNIKALSKTRTRDSSNQWTAEIRLDRIATGIGEDWCILGLSEVVILID